VELVPEKKKPGNHQSSENSVPLSILQSGRFPGMKSRPTVAKYREFCYSYCQAVYIQGHGRVFHDRDLARLAPGETAVFETYQSQWASMGAKVLVSTVPKSQADVYFLCRGVKMVVSRFIGGPTCSVA
jgi:hypothetical protein